LAPIFYYHGWASDITYAVFHAASGKPKMRIKVGLVAGWMALACTSTIAAASDLEWQLRTENNPMDRTSRKLVVSSYALDGGGSVEIQGTCTNGALSLRFSSFDSNDKPLPFDYSERGEVSARVKYDDDSPQRLDIIISRYKNSFSLDVTGHTLLSFGGANAIMYDLPLSDGQHAFPVIHPRAEVFNNIVQPCLEFAELEEKKQSEERQRQDRKHAFCDPLARCFDTCKPLRGDAWANCNDSCWKDAVARSGKSLAQVEALAPNCEEAGN
jgi:hypothetical protein